MREAPSFVKITDELGPKGFTIIGMALDRTVRPVKKFINSKSINYPVLMCTTDVVDDFGGIIGVPTSFLVNKNGVIVKRYQGYIDINTLRNDVERLLK